MSSFSIRTDIDGKLMRCFYNDTAVPFENHIGGSFDALFGAGKQVDVQVFLDMVREKGIPDHLIMEAPENVDEMILLSGINLESQMLMTGITFPAKSIAEMAETMKQVNLQQLEVLRYLLTMKLTDDIAETDDVTAEEKLLIEERKSYQLHQALDQQLKEMAKLSRMNSALQMCNSLKEVYEVIGDYTEEIFDSVGGSLFIFRPEINKFEVRVRWGLGEDRYALGLSEDSFMQMLNEQTSQQKITGFLQDRTTQDTLLLRIPEDSRLIGVLQVRLRKKIAASDPFFAQFQNTFLRLIGLAIANMRYREWLDQVAMMDHLTNLFNRRFMIQQLDSEVNRALRQGSFLSLVMLDLDRFTQVNDDYGHLVGDQYLMVFAKILSRCVRKEDYCCRYENDAFGLILVDSTQEDALMILDRIKAECTEVLVSEITMPMPFSSGVATFPTDGRNSLDVLRKAEEVMAMMKHRKHAGRNRTKPSGS